MRLRYFDISEFDSPDMPGSGSRMYRPTLYAIDEARSISGIPYIINSGVRTKSHNTEINGSPTSSHVVEIDDPKSVCYAVDIKCLTGQARIAILTGLLLAGFKRIGIGKDFIHADNDPNKVNSVWLYD